jgi:hypothetical protein
MMSLVMRKQIYMEVGYMQNRFRAWFIVKFWTIWYYVTHPSMYWERLKIRYKTWK